ncbi:hypothetical protein EVG20_g5218 [Dentipellis fragilis]|uniref:Uncharacterized protein n=1 Tax=Dentipellis fragilis TaxID=205917 RepID=A0A4Y9YVU8_9AGAM|nr:hypothetical protein EVG20_g5218 [Dentipellis fragilis]
MILEKDEKALPGLPGPSRDSEKLARRAEASRIEPPPAYHKVVEPVKDISSIRSYPPSPVVSSDSSSSFLPPLVPSGITSPAVNDLVLRTRREDIFGTWNIDPSLPRKQETPSIFNFGRRHDTNPPNVSLSSRNGSVMVRLAITGPSNLTTRVQAGTRKGSIHIDVFSKGPGKYVRLNTYTRKGDTVILLPRDYVGVVELRSRKGLVDILPSLAKCARILKVSSNGAIVIIGDSPSLLYVQDVAAAAMYNGDYGFFASRRGRVKIGFSGEDTTLPPEPGFWQRLGKRLLGHVGWDLKRGDAVPVPHFSFVTARTYKHLCTLLTSLRTHSPPGAVPSPSYKPASVDPVEMAGSSDSACDVPVHAGCFSAIFRSRRRRAVTSNNDSVRQRSTGGTGAPKRVDRDASNLKSSAAAVGHSEELPEYVTFASCCDFSGTLAREGAKPPSYFADVKELHSPEVIKTIEEKLKELDPHLRELSLKIHDHPELNFHEQYAHDLLSTFMSTHGFKVTPHYLGLDTAWRAEASHGTDGRVLGVNSEMDALPGIGHACGHNLIAVAGVGVALAVKAALTEHDIAGTVVLLGTPAEESGGGKQILLDRGGYKDMDACIMCHPFSGAPDNYFRVAPCLALQNIDIEYFGHTAHAAIAPWEGVNALDAAFLAYSSISVLRQQINPTHRVQGTVSGKDWTPNVIPDYAKMTWIVRAPTWAEVEVLRDRVINCLEAAALSTGCKHKLTLGERYMDLRQNTVLAESFAAVSQHHYGLPTQILDETMPASTDFGNVTYALPALHPVFFIPTPEPNSSPHTPGFALAARTPGAHASMLRVARSLALTGLRMLADDDFFVRARQAYEDDARGRGTFEGVVAWGFWAGAGVDSGPDAQTKHIYTYTYTHIDMRNTRLSYPVLSTYIYLSIYLHLRERTVNVELLENLRSDSDSERNP